MSKRLKPVLTYFDRPLTEKEQKLAMTAIAKACVKTSMPFNALEHESWKEVFYLLRKDFVPPTRYFLQKEITSVFVATRLKIETLMRLGYLAVDGWTDA